MIDQATINQIYDRADIVDVVSDYVSLKRRGVNYLGLCPFHNEKTPSFTVSPAKNICKCFGCGKGGNPINFIMEVENLQYYDALRFLAKKYNITIEEKQESAEEIQQRNERESLLVLTEWANKHFVANLETEEGKAIGKSYLLHRGFTEATIKKFQLGYALDQRDEYTQAAIKAGFKKEYLEKLGLTIAKENGKVLDRFHGRAIFPIHSLSGKVIGFGGRAIKKDEIAKYQNSPESDIYHKSQALYGVFFARNAIIREKKCYIVEGYADVISMVQAGVENIVAPCGTALTTEQIRLLHRILPSVSNDRDEDNRNVTMLYDGDSAGIHAALKNGKLLLEEGLNVKVVVLPPDDDPDSFAKSHNGSEVIEYLQREETDYIIFKTNHLIAEAGTDPIKKADVIAEIASTIAVIPNFIKRSVYSKECAKLLDTDEKIIYSHINKVLRKKTDTKLPVKAQTTEGQSETQPEEKKADTETPQTQTNQPQPQIVKPQTNFYYEECNIMTYIIKFGGYTLCEVEDAEEEKKEGEEPAVRALSVVEYIDKALAVDGITFQNPTLKQMFEEAKNEVINKGNQEILRYFVRHHNPEISKLAADLIAEPYQLSKMHGEIKDDTPDVLFDQVPHVVLDLKFSIVSHKVKELSNSLRTAKSEEEVLNIMTEMKKMQEVSAVLASQNGEKVYLGSR